MTVGHFFGIYQPQTSIQKKGREEGKRKGRQKGRFRGGLALVYVLDLILSPAEMKKIDQRRKCCVRSHQGQCFCSSGLGIETSVIMWVSSGEVESSCDPSEDTGPGAPCLKQGTSSHLRTVGRCCPAVQMGPGACPLPGTSWKSQSGGGWAAPDPLLLPRVEYVKLANEHKDAVNLGQGFPNFPPPDFAVEAFQQAVSGDYMLNQYTMAFVSLRPSRGRRGGLSAATVQFPLPPAPRQHMEQDGGNEPWEWMGGLPGGGNT